MLTTFQLRVMFSLEFCISWKHRCVAQCRTRASDVIFPTFIYSSIYWTPCKQISDAWFPSSSPPPSLSHLPPCTIPLLMCHSNFGVQDVSSRKRMCFFCVAYLRTPPPLLCYALTFFPSFIFREHIAAFQLYNHRQPIWTRWWVFFSTSCPFSSDTSQSHTFAITQLKTLHFSALAACLSLLARLWEFFSLFMSAELRMQSTLHSSTKPFWLS